MKSQETICQSHALYQRAEWAYYNGQEDSVAIYFEEAFKVPLFGGVSSLLNATDRLIRLEEYDVAKALLKRSYVWGQTIESLEATLNRYPQWQLDIDTLLLSIEQEICQSNAVWVDALEAMIEDDQEVRGESGEAYSDEEMKEMDFSNYQSLKALLVQNDNRLPERATLCPDAEEHLTTLLMHFDIEWIADLFPVLVDGIQRGYMYGESLLYQIDRTTVDAGKLYGLKDGQLVYMGEIEPIESSPFHYQVYGGYDLFVSKIKKRIWWPFSDQVERNNVNQLRKHLCLDSLQESFERQPYIEKVSDQEFLKLIGF